MNILYRNLGVWRCTGHVRSISCMAGMVHQGKEWSWDLCITIMIELILYYNKSNNTC
jgi:hypothetical protein